MKKRFALLTLVMLCACAPKADIQPMLHEFDDYSKDIRELSTDKQVLATLAEGQAKRDQAGALTGKKEGVPLAQAALADARLAFEGQRLQESSVRADQCRLEVEQARTKWSEAVYVLEQTEAFTRQERPEAKVDPGTHAAKVPELPATTLSTDSVPAASIGDAGTHWSAWRKAATSERVAAADLDAIYQSSTDALKAGKVDDATRAHQQYIANRTAQALECRVRAAVNNRVCLEAAQQTADYANGRETALRATLELERSLQADLRKNLDQLREESQTRQESLRAALSQMEGKFASIRQDARGTIVSLADILFDFDKATLRRDVEFNLVKIATILNQFGEMHVLVEGHTDAIGADDYNLTLSRKRAQAVYDFLVSQGVDAKRMSWDGYGETRPVADNETPEGRQKNRRVDLVIQDASASKPEAKAGN